MKKINLTLITIMLLFAAREGRAQQEPMISQYMTNQLFFNPAYAGCHDYTTVSGLYRKQWTDFPGAPQTAFASVDKNFLGRNVGLGATLINDKVGISDVTNIAVNYAYHIPMPKGHLSLGLRGELSYYNAQFTDLTVWDENDRVYASNIYGKWIPNFGAGAFYYTPRFYAGISVPHLLNYDKPSTFVTERISSVPNYQRHYYLSSGYVIGFPGSIYLKPSVLVKYVPDAPVQADFNANVFFLDAFSVGASYRTDAGMVMMAEINITKKLRLGYAYDWQTTTLQRYSNGTHEIMLAYDFIPDIIRLKSPRFF